MTPNEEQLVERIAEALETLVALPAEAGEAQRQAREQAEAQRLEERREWREVVEGQNAILARQADALERLAAAWGKESLVEVATTQGGVPAYDRPGSTLLVADPVADVAELRAAIARKNVVLVRMADGWLNAFQMGHLRSTGEDAALELERQARAESELAR